VVQSFLALAREAARGVARAVVHGVCKSDGAERGRGEDEQERPTTRAKSQNPNSVLRPLEGEAFGGDVLRVALVDERRERLGARIGTTATERAGGSALAAEKAADGAGGVTSSGSGAGGAMAAAEGA
jgi:hypothetical protein